MLAHLPLSIGSIYLEPNPIFRVLLILEIGQVLEMSLDAHAT